MIRFIVRLVGYGVWGSRRALRTLQQCRRQRKAFAQATFLSRHFPIISFVVVAGEVKQAMQNQNFDLLGQAMTEQTGVVASNAGGDRDLSGERGGFSEVGKR
jgi:hypothetical protein